MAERFKAMQERKREFGGGGGGGRSRYGGRDNGGGEGRFFGLGSIQPRGGGGFHGRDREKPPVMNSGRSNSRPSIARSHLAVSGWSFAS